MILGAGRPAASAAAVIVGTVRSRSVSGPTHQVSVPSARRPASGEQLRPEGGHDDVGSGARR